MAGDCYDGGLMDWEVKKNRFGESECGQACVTFLFGRLHGGVDDGRGPGCGG